jgi:broad specificity phosphatase PhoE
VYLVAEADAGNREEWPGPDRLRGQPIERVVASPWLRCRQTVQPLADQLGLDVDDDRALAETAGIDRAVLVAKTFAVRRAGSAPWRPGGRDRPVSDRTYDVTEEAPRRSVTSASSSPAAISKRVARE